MAKKKKGSKKAVRRPAGKKAGYDFDADLRKMKARLGARGAPGDAGAAAFAPAAPMAAGSTTVPRASVGAAVQAAVSFENATRVVAEATDAGAANFLVSWT